MPSSGRHRVVAATVCLALGGTALLTWAFSVFTEDKSKKRPGNAPSPLPPASTARGSRAGSLANGEEPTVGKQKPSSSVLAAEQLSGQGQEGPALVIENKAAVEPNKDGTGNVYPSYTNAKKSDPATTADIHAAPLPISEDAIAGQPVNFFEHIPTLDDRYNTSKSKTPIADAVTSEQISAVPGNKSSSQPGPIEQRISQLDTKVTTYEEQLPATQEMADVEGHSTSGSVPLSVSSRSLETSVMYAPTSNKSSRSNTGNVLIFINLDL